MEDDDGVVISQSVNLLQHFWLLLSFSILIYVAFSQTAIVENSQKDFLTVY